MPMREEGWLNFAVLFPARRGSIREVGVTEREGCGRIFGSGSWASVWSGEVFVQQLGELEDILAFWSCLTLLH